MTTATAYLDNISPCCNRQHLPEHDKVAGIMAHVKAVGAWDLPPVLVIEDEGDGPTLLDGHHRAEAARCLGIPRIPAWVVSVVDYRRVVRDEFEGMPPVTLAELDSYILVNGHPYDRSAHEQEGQE